MEAEGQLNQWSTQAKPTSQSGRYRLNCFTVSFSAKTLKVRTEKWIEGTDLKDLRSQFGHEWFLLRKGELVYGLPLVTDPQKIFGARSHELDLTTYEGLDFAKARLDAALPNLLPKYKPEHVRPFRFLGQLEEFISTFDKRVSLPEVVKSGFSIRPRFQLEARMIELTEGNLQVVVAMSIAMRWSIRASLASLADNKVNLTGLYVILRNPAVGERRIVGRIKSINKDTVELEESIDGRKTIETNLVQIEGSKASFKRCLSHLLGGNYKEFDSQREKWESGFTSGESFEQMLNKFITKPRQVTLGPTLQATIENVVSIHNRDRSRIFRELAPVEYCFDVAKTRRNIIPWNGLVEFGPYDSDTFEKRSPRILVIVPQSQQNKAEQVFGMFVDGVPNGIFPIGFDRLFNLKQVKFYTCPVADERLLENKYAAAYRAAVESHLGNGVSYDAAFVVVPDFSLQMDDSCNPYLHTKALLLSNGVPSQQLRISTIHQNPTGIQYVLRNIAVALYAKMDGTPWTVSQQRTYNDEIVIGMGMAEVAGSRLEARQRHMGITTVFLGDGNFLLSHVSKECSYEEYPEVLKQSTKSILAEVKRRNGWEAGDRVRIVFHSSKPLKNVEIDELIAECVSEVAGEQIVEFASLQISQDHPFKVIDHLQSGTKSKPPKGKLIPNRGFIMQLGSSTRLLSTDGPYQIKKPISPLPTPLLIHLHKRSTSRSLDALAEQVLKFTSMTWRSTSPSAMPVTIYYSELIAELLARFRTLSDWSPAMLNTKLRASKWFL